MIEKTLSMSFKNTAGKKSTLSIKDIKEDVLDEDVASLMDLIIDNNLIKNNGVFLSEKVSAQIVTKDTETVNL